MVQKNKRILYCYGLPNNTGFYLGNTLYLLDYIKKKYLFKNTNAYFIEFNKQTSSFIIKNI